MPRPPQRPDRITKATPPAQSTRVTSPKELGAIVHALPARDASEMLVNKARQRARGGGDNLSLAMVRFDAM